MYGVTMEHCNIATASSQNNVKTYNVSNNLTMEHHNIVKSLTLLVKYLFRQNKVTLTTYLASTSSKLTRASFKEI